MAGVEFFLIGEELWYRKDGISKMLSEKDHELIALILDRIRDNYPSAYKALESQYDSSSLNVYYQRFLIVRRFCKCNFGQLDTTAIDVDNEQSFKMEKVQCPLRGECPYEGVVCLPVFNSRLSDAQHRVMKLFYEGLSKEDISERLFISPETVKNHIRNAYYKLGVHTKAEFISLANKTNMFN